MKKSNTTTHTKFNTTKQVTCTVCKSIWRAALVIVPAALATYLFTKYNDVIILAVAALAAAFAMYQLWTSSYLAVKNYAK